MLVADPSKSFLAIFQTHVSRTAEWKRKSICHLACVWIKLPHRAPPPNRGVAGVGYFVTWHPAAVCSHGRDAAQGGAAHSRCCEAVSVAPGGSSTKNCNSYERNNKNFLIFIENQPKFQSINQATSFLIILYYSPTTRGSLPEVKLFLPAASLSVRICSSRHYLVQMGSAASRDTTVLLTPYKRLSWLPSWNLIDNQ